MLHAGLLSGQKWAVKSLWQTCIPVFLLQIRVAVWKFYCKIITRKYSAFSCHLFVTLLLCNGLLVCCCKLCCKGFSTLKYLPSAEHWGRWEVMWRFRTFWISLQILVLPEDFWLSQHTHTHTYTFTHHPTHAMTALLIPVLTDRGVPSVCGCQTKVFL